MATETTKGEEIVLKGNGYTVVMETACDKARRICNIKDARNQIYIKKLTYFYDVCRAMFREIDRYASTKGHDYIMGSLGNHTFRDKAMLKENGYTVNTDNLDYYKKIFSW